MLNTGMNHAETFQLDGLDPTLPLTAMSKAVHDHLGRSSHMLKSTNRAIWEGLEAFHGSGTAVGTGIRELASDAAAQSSRSMQVWPAAHSSDTTRDPRTLADFGSGSDGRAIAQALDVENENAAACAVAAAVDLFGGFDIVVSNAG